MSCQHQHLNACVKHYQSHGTPCSERRPVHLRHRTLVVAIARCSEKTCLLVVGGENRQFKHPASSHRPDE